MAASPELVLCYGDSNTFGQSGAAFARLPFESRWTTALQAVLGGSYTVVAEGLNGRTTVLDDGVGSEAMLLPEALNGRRYLLPCLHSHKPIAVVVLALGCNDLKDKHYHGPFNVVAGVRTLVADIRKSAAGPAAGAAPRVVVVSPPLLRETALNRDWGFNHCAERSRATIDAMAVACEQDGLAFVDLSAAASVGADGIHFEAEAGAPIAAAVAKAVLG